MRFSKRLIIAALAAALLLPAGCSKEPLDAKNPVTITVWHYYNGAIMSAFENILQTFNDSIGAEKGIIVESYGYGGVSDLEAAVTASVNGAVGSSKIPNIFASYADTAYEAEQLGILADLGKYFSDKEQEAYFESYIDEGKIGADGELRIFPIAKSTEVLMLNSTDWEPFAADSGLSYSALNSKEALADTAKLYYEWTDAQTPDVPNDGRAFFGRDSMANLLIIASKEFDVEIFDTAGGDVKINVDESVMRKIWDNYYVPYISGYFTAYGKYRSDDAKVGDVIAYIGSTSSASYFPKEVTRGGETYPVSCVILPAPHFKGAKRIMVQQGAGMVVTKGTEQEEYASVLFLKWFTEAQNNIEFAALSGYMPVKKEAVQSDLFTELLNGGFSINSITQETLRVALDEVQSSELYTSKAFSGGAAARSVLDRSLQSKAVADRELVVAALESGSGLSDAVAVFNNEESFQAWLSDLKQQLNDAVAG